MKIIVNPHKLEIEKSPVNEKEINITKCEFVFNDIEQDLVKKAFFTLKDTTYEQIIVNGECDIPSEVLEEQGQIEIGVIAYQVENEEYVKRYNPSPAYFTTWKGSLKEAENSSKPTPSQIEQIESEIAELQVNKQDTLVSGENIKTINNESLLGSGNIDLNETYYTKGEVDSIKTTIEGEIPTKVSQLDNDSEYITKEVNNLTYYTLATNTGSTIELGINTSTYVMTLNLKNSAGTTISTQSIDLPLESVVVSGSYDSVNKSIILTLQSGSTITIPVGDLVSGLQSEITPSNKLSSDLVDDTGHSHKFVTSSDITNWNNKIDQSALTDYVKNTDYATSSKGGVFKTNSSYATNVNNDGYLTSSTKTMEQYTNATTGMFISKGTLENVITGKELTNKTYVDGQNATQDTQIEALQEENNYLNSIIDQLPKVSGEGEYITLNNTIEGKLGLELGSTELEQFTTTGKNKFDGTNPARRVVSSVPNYTINKNDMELSGTGSWGNISLLYALTKNTDYTISFKEIDTISHNAGITINGTNVLEYATADLTTIVADTQSLTANTEKTITLSFNSGNYEYILFRFWNNSSSTTLQTATNLRIYNIQLETGSSATSYEPYTNGASPNPSYPQQIHTISGDNEILIRNRNLWNEEWEQGYYSSTGVKTSDNSTIRSKDYILVKPSTTYYFYNGTDSGGRICFFDKNKTFISTTTNSNKTITTPNNCKYITMSTSTNYGGIYKNDICINVSNANINGTYYPHQQQVKHINLGVENLINYGTQLNGYVDQSTMKFQIASSSIGYYFETSKLPDMITFQATNGNRANVCYFNQIPEYNTVSTLRDASNDNPRTITVNKTYKYIHIQFSYNYSNVTNIKITQGNHIQTISNTPIELCEIGDYKDEFYMPKGTNLFDKDTCTASSWLIEDGSVTSPHTGYSVSDFIPVLPNTSYYKTNTGSPRAKFYNSNKQPLNTTTYQDISIGGSEGTFTTPNDAYYLRLTINLSNASLDTIMLNEGSTALPYEPYNNGKWYLKKNIGKIVLDGSEYFDYGESGEYIFYRYRRLSNFVYDGYIPQPMLCNQFVSAQIGSSTTNLGFFITNTGEMRFREQTMKTIDNWKTHLSTNNLIVYYQLSTPTYILCNDTLQEQINDIYYTIKSYKEQTNISQVNNDLGFTIKASALLDLNSLIE